MKLKDSNFNYSADHTLTSNLVSFLVLWKILKFKDASGYLEISAELINEIYTNTTGSKFSLTELENLYVMVVMGLAGLLVKLERNQEKAVELCREAVSHIRSELIQSRTLAEELIEGMVKTHSRTTSIHTILSSDISFANDFELPEIKDKNRSRYDWLITKEYEDLLFKCLFSPYISRKTPVITLETVKLFPVDRRKPSKRRQARKINHESLANAHWWDQPKLLKNLLKGTMKPRDKSEPRRKITPLTIRKTKELSPLNVSLVQPAIYRPKFASNRFKELQRKVAKNCPITKNVPVFPIYHCANVNNYIESVLD